MKKVFSYGVELGITCKVVMNQGVTVYVRKYELVSIRLLWMHMKVGINWLVSDACYIPIPHGIPMKESELLHAIAKYFEYIL